MPTQPPTDPPAWMKVAPSTRGGADYGEPYGGSYGTREAEPESVLMSEEAVAWAAVISALGSAFATSRMATMVDAQIDETGMMWAQALSDVPAEAIPELHLRVLRRWTFSNPPTLGDFRKAWEAWDFYALRARDEGEGAPDLRYIAGALPEGPPAKDGPCRLANIRQMEILQVRGQMVTCDCENKFGMHPPCVLSPDLRFWVCASGIHLTHDRSDALGPDCGFEWPVANELEAPRRVGKGWQAGSVGSVLTYVESGRPSLVPVAADEAPEEAPRKPAPVPLSPLERLAQNLRLNLDAMPDADIARLTGFLRWYEAQDVGPLDELTIPIVQTLLQTWEKSKREAGGARVGGVL